MDEIICCRTHFKYHNIQYCGIEKCSCVIPNEFYCVKILCGGNDETPCGENGEISHDDSDEFYNDSYKVCDKCSMVEMTTGYVLKWRIFIWGIFMWGFFT